MARNELSVKCFTLICVMMFILWFNPTDPIMVWCSLVDVSVGWGGAVVVTPTGDPHDVALSLLVCYCLFLYIFVYAYQLVMQDAGTRHRLHLATQVWACLQNPWTVDVWRFNQDTLEFTLGLRILFRELSLLG
jgi:hypothetical protein